MYYPPRRYEWYPPSAWQKVMDEYFLILPIFTVLILWKKTHVDIGAEKKSEKQDSEFSLLLSLSDQKNACGSL